jgi:hypothetical protein
MAGKKAKLALFFGLCWKHPGYPKPIAHLPVELSMLVQGYLRDIKAVFGDWFSGLKFLIMSMGAVIWPLALLVVGGRDSGILSEIALAWSFLAIALLLLISLGAGFLMFRREASVPSIGAKRI